MRIITHCLEPPSQLWVQSHYGRGCLDQTKNPGYATKDYCKLIEMLGFKQLRCWVVKNLDSSKVCWDGAAGAVNMIATLWQTKRQQVCRTKCHRNTACTFLTNYCRPLRFAWYMSHSPMHHGTYMCSYSYSCACVCVCVHVYVSETALSGGTSIQTLQMALTECPA